MLEQYNSGASPSLVDEVNDAASNPLEIGAMHGLILLPSGTLMGDPQSELESYIPAILATLCDEVSVGRSYDMNPESLSFALYGTHDLAYLLMRLNGAPDRPSFVGPTMKVVRQGAAQDLIRICQEARKRAAPKRDSPEVYEDLTLRPVRVATT